MKKLLLISCLTLSVGVTAQNIFPDFGNAGVGTNTPNEELEVIGTIQAENGVFTNAPTGVYNFSTNLERVTTSQVLQAGYKVQPNSISRTLNLFDFPQSNMDAAPTFWFSLTDRADMRRFTMRAVQGNESEFIMHDKNQSEFFSIREWGNGVNTVVLNNPDSYLMIGTNSYTDNGENYKLNVNGKIRATEVKVYTGWADYVFEENYDLPSIQEVEEFIRINGHLINIPSAKEVEENGIKLGEMNKLLLEKIEELTLYLIDQNKRIEDLEKELNSQTK